MSIRSILRNSVLGLAVPLIATAGFAGGPAAAASDWNYAETDQLEVRSGDGAARAVGSVKWYYGTPPLGYRHRANYVAGSRIEATKAVGCIWVRVKFGFPTGSATLGVGDAAVSASPGEQVGSYFVNCRRSGQDRPAPLSLTGVGYAKALLNSTTLEVCTSKTKADGPRFCSFEKNVYGNG